LHNFGKNELQNASKCLKLAQTGLKIVRTAESLILEDVDH
jgi:hypothetical protein